MPKVALGKAGKSPVMPVRLFSLPFLKYRVRLHIGFNSSGVREQATESGKLYTCVLLPKKLFPNIFNGAVAPFELHIVNTGRIVVLVNGNINGNDTAGTFTKVGILAPYKLECRVGVITILSEYRIAKCKKEQEGCYGFYWHNAHGFSKRMLLESFFLKGS